jgi:hypothetical protein
MVFHFETIYTFFLILYHILIPENETSKETVKYLFVDYCRYLLPYLHLSAILAIFLKYQQGLSVILLKKSIHFLLTIIHQMSRNGNKRIQWNESPGLTA